MLRAQSRPEGVGFRVRASTLTTSACSGKVTDVSSMVKNTDSTRPKTKFKVICGVHF